MAAQFPFASAVVFPEWEEEMAGSSKSREHESGEITFAESREEEYNAGYGHG